MDEQANTGIQGSQVQAKPIPSKQATNNHKPIIAIAGIVVIAIIVLGLVYHNSYQAPAATTLLSTTVAPASTTTVPIPPVFIDTPEALFSNFSYISVGEGNLSNANTLGYANYSISDKAAGFVLVDYTSNKAALNGNVTRDNTTYTILISKKNYSVYNISFAPPNVMRIVFTGQPARSLGALFLYPIESLVLSGGYVLNQSSTVRSRSIAANMTFGNTTMKVESLNITVQYSPIVGRNASSIAKVSPYSAAVEVGTLPDNRALVVSSIVNSSGYWVTSLKQS